MREEAGEQAAGPDKGAKAPVAPRRRPGAAAARWALALGLISVIGLGSCLFVAYGYWLKHEDSLRRLDGLLQREAQDQTQLEGRIEAIRSNFAQQSQALAEQREQLEASRAQLTRRESEMSAALASVHRRLDGSSVEWMAAEADYLLRIAEDRLRLMRDVETALVALARADDRLRETRDPGWSQVREAIAADVAELRALSLPDQAGLTARLMGLMDQVDGLHVPVVRPEPGNTDSRAPAGHDEPSMKNLVSDGLAGLRSLLEIRRHDRPVSPMLPPEQQYYLLQNLRLQLQAASLAVVRADPALYRSSLETAGGWLKDFFDASDPGVHAMAAALADLAAVDVRPPLPDLSATIQLLRTRLAQPAGKSQDETQAGVDSL